MNISLNFWIDPGDNERYVTPSGVVLNTQDVFYKYVIPPGFYIKLDMNCLNKKHDIFYLLHYDFGEVTYL